jgi:D-aminoacyl-tRNA deacylase
VEIGSQEKNWRDNAAVNTVCKAIMKTVEKRHSSKKIGIGFGGTHYSTKFTKLIIETGFGLGSIIPKYSLDYIDMETIIQMIQKSVEKVTYAVLDWKGLRNKEKILEMIEKVGLEIIKI